MRRSLVLLIVGLLGLGGCDAGLVEDAPERVSGVIPDDPAAVDQVPTLTFAQAQNELGKRRARCGDDVCSGSESCSRCAADCGVCPPEAVCGDGTCTGGESCSTCATDCGVCPPTDVCGDGVCSGEEDCAACAGDCGACPAVCGDGVCDGGEHCSGCPGDCGACPTAGASHLIDMPPAADQGAEGSCVAFAVGYAARSADHYRRTGATSYSTSVNLFSPEYLYSQIKFSSDCQSGSAMQTALEYLKNHGITRWATVPYSASNGCSLTPTAAQVSEAAQYRIGSYSKLYASDHETIKTVVASDRPVIVSLLFCNEVISTSPPPGYVWRTCASGSLPHAVVITGYDDDRRAYRLLNSWGAEWGDQGSVWIDYDFFRTRTGTYVYAID
jgi:hypothetical protein